MKIVEKFLTVFLLAILVISTVLLIQIYWQENQKKFLKVIFLDVGQGDSIFIETPNGFQTIIDTGPNSIVVRSLSNFISFYDRKINLLITTHSDSDHVGGAVEILKRFKIQNFGKNSIIDNDSLNTEIQNIINEKQVDEYFLKSGDKIILDALENIYLEVLWPPQDHNEKDNNDNSLVLRLVYIDIKFILTGDASTKIEEKLLQNNLKSDVLKAGHHGSRTSTSENFLSAVNPEFVIISAGRDNRFGHPHQEVLDNIENFSHQQKNNKIKILETFVLGSIYFQSNGLDVWLVE
jgi:beta-lactamase superfamily II metal-dependent hydrolase